VSDTLATFDQYAKKCPLVEQNIVLPHSEQDDPLDRLWFPCVDHAS
jgi:hypothetical protein